MKGACPVRCGICAATSAILMLAGLLTAGCSTSPPPGTDSGDLPAGTGFQDLLPPPSQLPKTVSYDAEDRLKVGRDFRPDLPFNRITGTAITTILSPDYTPGGSLSGVAYGIYRFRLLGYDEEAELTLAWEGPQPAPNSCYIGLTHWRSDSWHWYRLPATNTLEFASLFEMLDYFDPDGDCFVVVALTGTAETRLEFLRFGGRTGYWHSMTVDADHQCNWSSMAIDSQGRPHIVYQDNDLPKLRYATYNGLSWQLEPVGIFGGDGYAPSLVLDDADRPHIVHYNDIVSQVQYVYFDGADWQWHTVETDCDGGSYPAIVLGEGSDLHICYYQGISATLFLRSGTPGSWPRTIIQDGFTISRRTTIARDSLGKLHICFYDTDVNRVMYARVHGGLETLETVEDTASLDYPYLALGFDDRPFIAYCINNGGGSTLKLARPDGGGGWLAVEIGNSTSIGFGQYCALAFDEFNIPHLAYDDPVEAALVYNTGSAFDWYPWQVDTGVDIDPTNSIALDSRNRPYIAWTDDDVEYMRLEVKLD